MQKQIINITEYAVARSSETSGGCLNISKFEPMDSSKGTLIFFIEIEISDKDNEIIIETLKKELEKQYFNAPTDSLEFAFESALAKANLAVKDLLLSKPKNWLTKIHIAVLAIFKEEVNITNVGNVHAFLTHQDRIVDIIKNQEKGHYRSQDQKTPNPVKLFSNIISGKLLLGDSITITNESALDYISAERIRKITLENSPIEALEKLLKLLSNAPSKKQFGFAMIKRLENQEQLEAQETEAKEEPYERKNEIELDDYFKNEETQRNFFQKTENKEKLKEILLSLKFLSSKALEKSLFFMSKILDCAQKYTNKAIPVLVNIPTFVISLWKNRKARDYHFLKLKNSIKNKFLSFRNKILEMPKKKKIALIGIIILATIFSFNIYSRSKQQTKQAHTESFLEKIQEIEKNRDQAQAALIYREDSKAREIIYSAMKILEELPRVSEEEINTYESLKKELENLLDRSEKKTRLSSLMVLANITSIPVSQNKSGIILFGDRLFFYNGEMEKILKFDENSKLLIDLPLVAQGIESFQKAIHLRDNIIVAIKQDTVIFIDSKKETITKEQFITDISSIPYFKSYGGNIYTINKNDNQIIRYRQATRGFTPAQKWLQRDYDLSGIQDIAIDGFIYALFENGDVQVFLNGIQTKTIKFPLEDSLGDNPSLFTNENLENLYILDQENKRILIISKNGDLKSQLLSEEFSQAKQIIINNEETIIYILAKDKIYQAPIQ